MGSSCGTGEVLVIVFVLVVVFSASRMGVIGNALGKFVHSFKKASQGEGFVEGRVTRKLERQEPPSEAELVDEPRGRGPGTRA